MLQFPEVELRVVKDEPGSQGAWNDVGLFMPKYGDNCRGFGRAACAAPGNGYASRHAAEQADLVNRAFSD